MQTADPSPQQFTRAQAALWLNLSERHVDRLIADGELRTIRWGRAVRITEPALIECQRNREARQAEIEAA